MNLRQEDVALFNKFLDFKEPFEIAKFCFDKQLAFITDEAKFKTSVCSRRAGKTVACAAHLVHAALSKPKQVCLYITLSRLNAKRIIWSDLLDINRRYDLNAHPNETELSLRFDNGSVIYLSGAKDSTEIEKFRGLAISLCYIDECQSFKSYIKELIDDVIAKALFDYNGTLCLIGTPGPVPTGYFYECATSAQWSHHGWTFFDNPWIERKSGKTPQYLLDQELTRKGVSIDDPSIQREVFGRWTVDFNSLVFRYDKDKNSYSTLPQCNSSWHYIIGIDVGYDDADAIAVIGWNDKLPQSFLIEEIVTRKQGISALAGQISQLINKYDPHSVVMDTGGLGKKIAEEISNRFGLPIKAAEKARKFEFIELLNDAMRTGKFYVEQSSQFAQDAMLVEWDKDAPNLKVSDRFHSDITDAVLYSFRESLHWLHVPDKIVHPYKSAEWFDEEAKTLEAQALVRLEKQKSIDKDEFMFDGSLADDSDWN